MTEQNFVVIDTEGKRELSEIAVIDSQGKLIYEAFTEDHPNNTAIQLKCKSLRNIVSEFATLVQSKILVCHYAAHDRKVLRNSFIQAGVRLPSFSFECSCELARRCFPNLPEYSLRYLSKHFLLKVKNRYSTPISLIRHATMPSLLTISTENSKNIWLCTNASGTPTILLAVAV
jgi:hypothetical protein